MLQTYANNTLIMRQQCRQATLTNWFDLFLCRTKTGRVCMCPSKWMFVQLAISYLRTIFSSMITMATRRLIYICTCLNVGGVRKFERWKKCKSSNLDTQIYNKVICVPTYLYCFKWQAIYVTCTITLYGTSFINHILWHISRN